MSMAGMTLHIFFYHIGKNLSSSKKMRGSIQQDDPAHAKPVLVWQRGCEGSCLLVISFPMSQLLHFQMLVFLVLLLNVKHLQDCEHMWH
jgi:hypothetical protein